ncbi:hypothetical protein DEA8626_00216 [Defluviimonas aquaemixtae]|uniref:CAAX prenyl protease 2/Lysostaphin resistance protein A-like domain-containing protein n=1 Tax=Albidovulum aquaemixtae TaxID=1542388 RepID=A0A2R8B2D1_9RHOB|nr:CPBP family intramembrane glutamic endopeptidase [Defluviimonas aquaemixtae]SPH16705.1 hypothetical protein DEA8626_00216 [Defluviimonas aquaemixtae]
MLRAYSPHERYVSPARRRAELWRLVVGSALIIAVYLGSLLSFQAWLTARYGEQIAHGIVRRMLSGDTPGGALMLLFGFLGLALGPMAAAQLIHRRRAGTLFGPSFGAAVHDFLRVIGPLLAFQLALLPFVLVSDAIRPGLALATFLGYLPFALTGILIQTGAEELVFRGYLQQQLAARFRTPILWMGLPAVLFAWGHYLPGEHGPNAALIALWAAVFSCLAADLTARTGTLGAAIAFHAANNVAAFLLVGLDGNIDGLALWSLAVDPADPAAIRPLLAADFLTMIIGWLLVRLRLRV